MIDGQKTLKELFTSYEFGSVTRSEYNDVATIVENEREFQRKMDIENACAEINAILEEYGIKSYDRSRNLKRIKQAMEE